MEAGELAPHSCLTEIDIPPDRGPDKSICVTPLHQFLYIRSNSDNVRVSQHSVSGLLASFAGLHPGQMVPCLLSPGQIRVAIIVKLQV